MMKFFFYLIMIGIMMSKNKFNMFIFNLFGLMSVMFLFSCSVMMNKVENMYFYVDYYSYMMIMLLCWVMSLMSMMLEGGKEGGKEGFMFILMMFILLMYFLSSNMLMFYFFFELSLIPIYMVIIYWGYNIERMKASYYLLIYTMLISLPLLIYVMMLISSCGVMDLSVLVLMKLNSSWWSLIIILGAFLVKLPVFGFHFWLPKAHVEAPTYGSMVLAAVLLKMGGYGLIRLLMIFVVDCIWFKNFIISVGIIGSLMVSMICLVQVDMKMMVAYSSVVHMNVMLCSLMSLTKLGFVSSYIIMISHGLCSSGLFYMVGVFFNQSTSRLLVFNKGLINLMSSMMIWWFLVCIFNISFPLGMGFLGEIVLMGVLILMDKLLILYLMIISVFSSLFSLYLYISVSHGGGLVACKNYGSEVKEFLIMSMHLYPLVFMLISVNFF